jgi:predicted ester cyclase
VLQRPIELALFPDAHSTVDDQIAEGDRVATRWTATGTGANGKRYELHGITIERIADSQIVEVWMNRDDVSMQQQLS